MKQTTVRHWTWISLACCLIGIFNPCVTHGQGGGAGLLGRQAVGGITINPAGVVGVSTVDDVRKLRAALLENVPGLTQPVKAELKAPAELRKVSLRQLQATIQKYLEANEPLPDEVRYLAGLQSIRHVFVYPEQQDIVLAGYAEGWRADERGFVVGLANGRPVLQLDDLAVAVRTAYTPQALTCSIDPTAEGLDRLRAYVSTLKSAGNNLEPIRRAIEERLGLQTITLGGLDPSSHLAQVLVASDFKMKRIAMALDKSPVPSLPSYMTMLSGSGRGLSNMLPRWWLTTDYEPLAHDGDKLAWELAGPRVKAMSEEDRLGDQGTLERGARHGGLTQKWAEMLTAKYAQLAIKEPIFGQLQGVMDLTVVAALMSYEKLTDRAQLDLSVLAKTLPIERYLVATQSPSITQAMVKGTSVVISASGGVELRPLEIVSKQSPSTELAPVRQQHTAPTTARWWWN